MCQCIRHRRMMRALGMLVVALVVGAPSLVAQNGTITGRVIDTGSGLPVASAQVFIAGLDLGVLTQANGGFSLADVLAGTHTVTVQRLLPRGNRSCRGRGGTDGGPRF